MYALLDQRLRKALLAVTEHPLGHQWDLLLRRRGNHLRRIGPTFVKPGMFTVYQYGRKTDAVSLSGGKAWAQPTPQPLSAPSVGPTKGMSFVAIQHAQQEQTMPIVDKRSLREIQEEEHALQEEADFLKWWTAEEERIRREEEQALALAQAASTKSSNANKTGRKKERRKNR